jgi:hypothetical protein
MGTQDKKLAINLWYVENASGEVMHIDLDVFDFTQEAVEHAFNQQYSTEYKLHSFVVAGRQAAFIFTQYDGYFGTIFLSGIATIKREQP